jgi:hypothetical protein
MLPTTHGDLYRLAFSDLVLVPLDFPKPRELPVIRKNR